MIGDWRFLLRPKWLLSHLFVGAIAFVWAVWQLRRLDEKKTPNALVEARAQLAPVPISEIHDLAPDEIAFQPVSDTGHYVEDELTRVANRSLDGVAGDWSWAHFVTDDGEDVLVNRGFILRDEVTARHLIPHISTAGSVADIEA
ncbi:MAG: SURF1 family protein [Acidimicrobiales bacterium]